MDWVLRLLLWEVRIYLGWKRGRGSSVMREARLSKLNKTFCVFFWISIIDNDDEDTPVRFYTNMQHKNPPFPIHVRNVLDYS